MTAVFLRFLRDRRQAMRDDAINSWENGTEFGLQGEARGRILEMGEILDLTLVQIQTFYQTMPLTDEDSQGSS